MADGSNPPAGTIEDEPPTLTVTRMGIDTHDEPIVYLVTGSDVARSEGFEALARVRLHAPGRTIIAALNLVDEDLLEVDQAGLSDAAWDRLGVAEGDVVEVSHPWPLRSMSDVRRKAYGHRLKLPAYRRIIQDVVAGRLSSPQIASFLTACAGDRMDLEETVALTQAMIEAGERLTWDKAPIVDKHSVGGLPGNRTTPIVVPIVAAAGLTMPKTSSRAITSPAGTADTMETLTEVDLDLAGLQRVVAETGGCLAWGGSVQLSPADDMLIKVERSLDLDAEGQMVASVLSKKAAAGSTHVVIDMPIGPTAKVRSQEAAQALEDRLVAVGEAIGLTVRVVRTDGSQPVGRGIGPALEARDVLAVLQGHETAPRDLRERALTLAGAILEMVGHIEEGQGVHQARQLLDSQEAWERFQAICRAQGGLRQPPVATYEHAVTAEVGGTVASIDNRRLARVAKLAGAPEDPAAGVMLDVHLGDAVDVDAPLFTIHAESPGELAYALRFVEEQAPIFELDG